MELLSKHFDLALETPDGIKKLRELILSLAMQGKLVPQDPNDQPASELLRDIEFQKKQLSDTKKLKSHKNLLAIKPEMYPYELPVTWHWTKLGNIAVSITDGVHYAPAYISKGVPCISAKDIYKETINLNDCNYVSPEEYNSQKEKFSLTNNSLLVTKSGSIGRTAIYDGGYPLYLVESIGVINFFDNLVEPKFIKYLLNKTFTTITYNGDYVRGLGVKHLTLTLISSILTPLPPYLEQRRIVRKIDQLMALCDELEKTRNERNNKRLKIHTAAINKLLAASDKIELKKSWNFITKNFSELYSIPENIEELKKAILQLAMMGKLVPQDKRDEPAGVLLRNIDSEKKRVVRDKLKKQDSQALIMDNEIPFELPQGWEWIRLGHAAQLITKGSSPNWQGVNYTTAENGVLFITSENVDNHKLKLSNKKYVEKHFNEIESRSILKKNDILMNIVGASIGRVAYYDLDEVANINQAVCLIRLLKKDCPFDFDYILYFLNSPICLSYMFEKQVDNARANLSMSNISKFIIPLPPLAEQKRIVAKIGQLMELCNNLQHQINDSTEKKTAILNCVLQKY